MPELYRRAERKNTQLFGLLAAQSKNERKLILGMCHGRFVADSLAGLNL
jgi:hypothetical protein